MSIKCAEIFIYATGFVYFYHSHRIRMKYFRRYRRGDKWLKMLLRISFFVCCFFVKYDKNYGIIKIC